MRKQLYIVIAHTGTQHNMSFNFNNYDNWLKKSKHTIFMSEYTMPFQKLIEINKRILLSQFNKDGKGEGLYINKPIKVKSDT